MLRGRAIIHSRAGAPEVYARLRNPARTRAAAAAVAATRLTAYLG